jgi:hypothetical protein
MSEGKDLMGAPLTGTSSRRADQARSGLDPAGFDLLRKDAPHAICLTHFSACIIEAARAGNRPKVIAEEIGSTPKSVMVILSKARRKGIEIPRFDAHGNIKRQAA